jgi:hypothetical protein
LRSQLNADASESIESAHGEKTMAKKVAIIVFLTTLFLLIFMSCKKSVYTPDVDPTATLESYNGCKSFQGGTDRGESQVDSRKECIEYEYDGESILKLKHVNSGFNCCPGKIVAEIEINDKIITIEEKETGPLCHCLCLFDVNYKISNLKPGVYEIQIKCPCHGEGERPIEFTVNLYVPTSGTHCVNRTHYPWGT